MTAGAGEAIAGVAKDRISAALLTGGALRRAHEAGWPALLIGVVIGGAYAGIQVGADALGLDLRSASMDARSAGYYVAIAMTSGLGAAVATRILLEGRRARWWRMDRGLLESAAINTAAGLLFGGLGAGFTMLQRLPADRIAVATVALGLVYAALAYVWLKVSLWPIGRLQGRADLTPARSWRLMRKATRALVLGYLGFGVVFMLFMGGASIVLRPLGVSATVPLTVATYLGYGVFSLAAYGMSATLYRLRVENPATVADVFD